ncbi:HPP family protein [Rhodobacter sp. SY28-1]|uniref:HPP family protein n=1 Tax=Rhodobacter sp. SY28-1 TaxID=2562317 RepID=UPI0010C03973|nr:HPP family protein [Rhodobacter sp. SY28-1]
MADLRGLGPAMAGPKPVDVARAATGVALGLLLVGVSLRWLGLGWLIAPFGASAVLIYAVPNSPLAQPWSVVVGNSVSALVALAVLAALPPSEWAVALAVGLAILAMLLARALHPPGGAVALFMAVENAGDVLMLATVAVGSAALVGLGILWNWSVGRSYPFRQPAQPGAHGTLDPAPQTRLGLDPADLAGILEDFHQSANLGVADLARLIGAAEQAAAARRMENFTCADVMSRDLVTVGPEAPLSKVAELFRSRGFTSLPVVAEDGRFLGLIFQLDLIRRAREDAFRLHRSLLAALVRLIDDHRSKAPMAGDIMQTAVQRVTPRTPVGALLPILSDGGAEAVPVVVGPKVVGIVTRTDLVSALATRLAQG